MQPWLDILHILQIDNKCEYFEFQRFVDSFSICNSISLGICLKSILSFATVISTGWLINLLIYSCIEKVEQFGYMNCHNIVTVRLIKIL